jgi:putative hydrolase of the HAD superfamily
MKTVVVFDLDDTIYKEIDYLKSAYKAIATYIKPFTVVNVYAEMLTMQYNGEPVFEKLISKYRLPFTLNDLLLNYRTHMPSIKSLPGFKRFLKKCHQCNIPLGLITDGRSITQRNKLKALNIEDMFEHIIISEEIGSSKPDFKNYALFATTYSGHKLFYIADNANKDFVTPNQLQWQTVQINVRTEDNINKVQNNLEAYRAKMTVNSYAELYQHFESHWLFADN